MGNELRTDASSGIQRYMLEILREMDGMIEDGEVELLVSYDEKADFDFRHIKTVRVGRKLFPYNAFGKRLRRVLYKDFFCARYIRKNNAVSADVLMHFPKFGCDMTVIHDCIREKGGAEYDRDHPEMAGKRDRMRERETNAAARAKMIVTVSESSKEDIRHFYNPACEISVVPCGWQHFARIKEDESILEKLGLQPKSYFFSLGTLMPHKNMYWVACAARDNPEYTFVISGLTVDGQGNVYNDEVYDNMIFTGYISDGEVKALMKNCRALIHPSRFEGFGMPPLEAMSVGADCIVSNRPALPEIYENSVWYIDPVSYDNINLKEIMSAPKEGSDKILEKYSWEKSAEKLLGILRGM